MRTPELALLLTFLALPAAAQDWSQWRGPHFTGAADVVGLPPVWSPTENVVWKTELPGQSAATPVVLGDRIFLTAFVDATMQLQALCLDRATGKQLWARDCGTGQPSSPRSRGRENTLAACSPVASDDTVVFLFGSGDLVAFDHAGEERWRTNLVEDYGELVLNWGYAASPLLLDGTLVVPILRRSDSLVAAYDVSSGELLWENMRPSDARAESQEAYTTPIPFKNGERQEVLIFGGDALTAHDPATGEELWRWDADVNPRKAPNFRAVSSAVVGERGTIFVTTPQHGPMHGLRVSGEKVEKLWQLDGPTPDSTTPLFYRGRLYAVDGRNQRIVCLEPMTGEKLWQADLETPTFLRASPTGADGKVYVVDAEGTVVVLLAGDVHEELLRVAFDSYPTRSSIAAVAPGDGSAGGRLLVRTAEHLFCIGRASPGQDEESR